MPDIFDYLSWRGDLTFACDSFNNVDALILSLLSYFDFDNFVPPEAGDGVSLKHAARGFLENGDGESELKMPQDKELLQALMAHKRYCDIRLHAYVNEVDFETQKQFAAVTVDLGNGEYFYSFRGTDNTLVGWKEAFNLSFMTVPAQQRAVRYMQEVSAALPGGIRTGGHSKGGNLAIYSAAFSGEDIQKRLLSIHNFDGPGFNSAVLRCQEYLSIRDRLHTFIPQSSVVGMLLEHEDDYRIVSSRQMGFLQHDLYTWNIETTDFAYLSDVTRSSRFLDGTLRYWIGQLDSEQRGQFIDAIYSVFLSTDVHTIREFTDNWLKNALTVVKSLKNLKQPTRSMVSHTLAVLLSSVKQNIPKLIERQNGSKEGELEPDTKRISEGK